MRTETYDLCDPVIVGDSEAIKEACKVVEGAGDYSINTISSVSEAKFEHGTIDVLHVPDLDIEKRKFRKDRKKLLEQYSEEKVARMYEESQKMTVDCAFKYIVKYSKGN